MYLIFLFLLLNGVQAQFDEPGFFKRVNENYYSLENSDIDNFSAWITSDSFKDFTDKFYGEEIFPLEFVWVKPNDVYFIRRPLPALSDSSDYETSLRAQRDLQFELRNLLENWQRLYAGKLLADMPVNYTITIRSDSIFLFFAGEDHYLKDHTQLIFANSGLLLQYRQIPADSSIIRVTNPEYKFTGEFWLCTGWQVSQSENDNSGLEYKVQISSQKVDKYWIPEYIRVIYENNEKRSKTYHFRNVRVNRDIQVLNGRN